MHDHIIERLAAAYRDNTRIDLTGEGPADMAAGYDIQDRLTELRAIDIAAWKIGATNAGAQKLLGVGEPFAGCLPEAGLLSSPTTISMADLAGPPVIEAEIGLRVDGDGQVTEVVPCIEVACSRLTDMIGAGGPAIAADNGGAYRLIVGDATPISEIDDLVAVAASMTCDGEPKGGGTGADVLGDPRNAVTWLAAHVASRGQALADGTLISTGALAMAPNAPVGHYVADYGPLGTLELHLV